MNIIITMAGLGTRFREAGYTQPKFMIEVGGHSLFSWAIKSLQNFITPQNNFIFISRHEDRASEFIERECKKQGIKNIIQLELTMLTDGQSTTTIEADKIIP
ncbi:unnamed protein product, partial [marine sediment metagenome]